MPRIGQPCRDGLRTPYCENPDYRVTHTTLSARARSAEHSVQAHDSAGAADVALDAGIYSIEHGALLSSAQLERMAAQGTFLVLTTWAVAESDPRVPARIRAMMAEANAQYHDTIRRALEAGVQLAGQRLRPRPH